MIDRKTILDLAATGARVTLIKELRETAGMIPNPDYNPDQWMNSNKTNFKLPLDKAKKAIDDCVVNLKRESGAIPYIFDTDKLLKTFAKYNLQLFNQIVNVDLMKSLQTASEQWENLGFNSVYEACRMVLDNYEKK